MATWNNRSEQSLCRYEKVDEEHSTMGYLLEVIAVNFRALGAKRFGATPPFITALYLLVPNETICYLDARGGKNDKKEWN